MPEKPSCLDQPQRQSLGDVLLVFSKEQGDFPGRLGPATWPVEAEQDGWRFLVQAAGPHWKGFPHRFIHVDQWHIWLLGEIYGAEKDQELFFKEIVLGRESPTRLNGHFLLLAWDSLAKTWHVWTDRFGTLHAYYATDGKRAALGTFFPAAAAAASSRRLDWLGLSGFFACGFFPQDRTFFEDVKILRPASHYVFAADGGLLRQERYWKWRHEPRPDGTYDDTVAEFAHILHEVMHDHTSQGRVAVPISGGLDSRSAVAALTQAPWPTMANGRFWAYSYGSGADSVETSIARRVAAARGLPFRPFSIPPYLFDRLTCVLASVEGFQDVTQCRQAAVADALARQADFVLAAHWGDVWLDDMGLIGKERASVSDDFLAAYALRKMSKGGSRWLLNNFHQPKLTPHDCESLLRGMVSDEMASLGRLDDPDFRLKAFKTDQWSFRWTTASLRMFQAAAFPRLPFYDTRLADFFCTVPSAFVKQRRLQIDYLKRFAPDLARIAWQVYDANLFRCRHFHTWLLPKRAIKKAWRLLSGKAVVERNWEVQFLHDDGRQGLKHWLLQPGLRLHEFFQPAALAGLLEDFYLNPLSENRGYTVAMLLTFSAWLEKYG